ncbi:hypothetical protein ACHAWF_016450 [Thalassiosira exigua]
MSLRQRGQRPSEATDESAPEGRGGGGGGGGFYAAGGGGAPPHQPHRPRPPPPGTTPSYAGVGDGTPAGTPRHRRPPGTAMPSPASGGGGGGGGGGAVGGYYSGYIPGATPPAPAAGGGYNNGSSYARAGSASSAPGGAMGSPSFPRSAPPAYGNNYASQGSYGSHGSLGTPRNLDGGGSGGGYGANPYQRSKSSSSSSSGGGFGWRHLFLTLLSLTFLVLTSATLYLRGRARAAEAELVRVRERAERRGRERERGERTGGRYGPGDRGREREPRGGVPGGGAGGGGGGEKARLEEEIRRHRDEIASHRKRHEELTEERDASEAKLKDVSRHRQDLMKEVDEAKYDLEDAEEEAAKYRAMVDGMDEVEEYMKKREGALWSRIESLEKQIGQGSWREAEEWFGPGPHRVEMEVEYPRKAENLPDRDDPGSWPRVREKVVIEMAPLDVMPHVVNLFLQQVHHRLWDGCSAIYNAPHILQLGPSYDEEKKASDPHYDQFHEKGLEMASYQEYNPKYPHERWTLGLSGRPGGPDFYVNKLDNTLIHGPGGQANKHDLHNEADPCFGTIAAESHRVLEEINAIPTDKEKRHALEHPVTILKARVMAPADNPADGWKEIESGKMLDEQDGIVPLPDAPPAM